MQEEIFSADTFDEGVGANQVRETREGDDVYLGAMK